MVKVIEGELISRGQKFALIAGRFNDFITQRLVEGALDALKRHGAGDDDVDIYWVPGAFEIPYLADKLAKNGGYQALIGLGAVIRGDTSHADHVAQEAAKGIARAAVDSGLPVIFGVITAETIEQAIERAGTKDGNKGVKAAMAALEMANLYRKIEK